MNERVFARTGKQIEKMAPQHMGLAKVKALVELEDVLLQAWELEIESSKRRRRGRGRGEEEEEEEEEEETAVNRQLYNTMAEIINWYVSTSHIYVPYCRPLGWESAAATICWVQVF